MDSRASPLRAQQFQRQTSNTPNGRAPAHLDARVGLQRVLHKLGSLWQDVALFQATLTAIGGRGAQQRQVDRLRGRKALRRRQPHDPAVQQAVGCLVTAVRQQALRPVALSVQSIIKPVLQRPYELGAAHVASKAASSSGVSRRRRRPQLVGPRLGQQRSQLFKGAVLLRGKALLRAELSGRE